MNTMKCCQTLYLKLNVLLSVDVFEIFKNNSLENQKLFQRKNYAPGLSWDAMLKKTKIKLEHIAHPNMYISFEKWARGRST